MLLPSFGSGGGGWRGSPPLLPSTPPKGGGGGGGRAPLFSTHPIPRTPNCYTECTHSKRPPFLSLSSCSRRRKRRGRNCGDSVQDGKGRRKEEEEHFFSPFFAARTAFIISSLPEFGLFFAISARVPIRTRADALTDPNNSGGHAPDFPSKIVKIFLPSSSSLALSRQSEEKSLLLSSYGGRGSRGRRDRHHSAGHSLAIVCV